MCLLSFENKRKNSPAYLAGLERFACGGCPECLRKKSNYWVLRASMESVINPGVMVTLTYDNFIRDKKGNIIGETPPDCRELSKKDCQDFIKRLRRYFKYHSLGDNIKYLLAAEHGKSGRSHYHALLFGVQFTDIVPYKKSKRGNMIYHSRLLTKLWGNGIATVDCLNLNGAVASYCTKYCSKDYGIDDTFMLFSHGIGEAELRRRFNGLNYVVEGRLHPVPKSVWQWYILNKYQDSRLEAFNRANSVLYRAPDRLAKERATSKFYPLFMPFKSLSNYITQIKAERNALQREIYRSIRDNDSKYKRYLAYWKNKTLLIEQTRMPDKERILHLDNQKYWFYKQAALRCYSARLERCTDFGIEVPRCNYKITKTFAPPPSRHKGANDTKITKPVLFLLDNIKETP